MVVKSNVLCPFDALMDIGLERCYLLTAFRTARPASQELHCDDEITRGYCP